MSSRKRKYDRMNSYDDAGQTKAVHIPAWKKRLL